MLSFRREKTPEVFFIRGFAKSGTNWLCNLLNQHPKLTCKGEFHFESLFEGYSHFKKGRWSILNRREFPKIRDAIFARMIEQLVVEVCGRSPVCGNRTPGTIRSTFLPGVKHVYLTRDGRDVLVSWVYHSFNRNLSESKLQGKYQQFLLNPHHFEENKHELLSCESVVRNFAARWNKAIVDDFEMLRLADEQEINLPYTWVRYEDLHANTLQLREDVLSFLGLNPKQACALEPHTQPGFDGRTNDPQAFFRRGATGAWSEYFTDEQLHWFEDEAKEALELVGAR